MRIAGLAGMTWITGCAFLFAGCSDEPIGQPCNFKWPVTEKVDQSGVVVVGDDGKPELTDDCGRYPRCAPLQDTGSDRVPGDEPENMSCPVDCIQTPSLECTNLYCVATQVEEDAEVEGVRYDKENVMNGECNTDLIRTNSCVQEDQQGTTAKFGCKGYCTKECLSDASCPKGYRCVQMAPFAEGLRCDNEDEWGDGGGDTAKQCTNACQPTGYDLGENRKCPSSVSGDDAFDNTLCDMKEYKQEYKHCCTCICYEFCPMLTKKFCRRIEWDHKKFPNGVVDETKKEECREQTD